MDGLILVNKPKKITSRDVVNIVGKKLHTKKIGHTGTLDPMATGVLILCIGKATKIVDLITSHDKEYIAEVTLGLETDTLDIEGKLLKEEDVKDIDVDEIECVLKSFIGESKQEVPIYSAVKVNGKKLYEYARGNQEVKLPIKDIYISKLDITGDILYEVGKVKFKIDTIVSKGTYIRSLVRDIGAKLNTIATMSSLERVKQGIFKIEDCYSLDEIGSDKYKIITIKEALSFLPKIIVEEATESKIRNGAIIDKTFNEDKVLLMNKQEEILAIYQTYDKDNTKAKPLVMLL